MRQSLSGDVVMEVDAVSRLRNPLARLVPPIAEGMQRRAAHGYLDAIELAVQRAAEAAD